MLRPRVLDLKHVGKQVNELFLRHQAARLARALFGPTTFSFYVIAAWGLTADFDLTRSFPWPQGPLSNWMVWLALALAFRVVPSVIHRASKQA